MNNNMIMTLILKTQELGKLTDNFVLGSEYIKTVNNFKYLGNIRDKHGRNYKEINARGNQQKYF